MKIKFIDGDHQIKNLEAYSKLNTDLDPNLPIIAEKNGIKYMYLGKSEKSYSFGAQMWMGVRAIVKTVFSLGLSESTRDDWEVFKTGKKTVVIYNDGGRDGYYPNLGYYSEISKKILESSDNANAPSEQGNVKQTAGNSKDVNQEPEFEKLKKAADDPEALAERVLGGIYLVGSGVDEDREKAYKNLKKAADSGDSVAEFQLASVYAIGSDIVDKNDREAFKYFKRVADKNNARAQFKVGELYRSGGIGIKRDQQESLKYMKLAAGNGDRAAQNYLNYLKEEQDQKTNEIDKI